MAGKQGLSRGTMLVLVGAVVLLVVGPQLLRQGRSRPATAADTAAAERPAAGAPPASSAWPAEVAALHRHLTNYVNDLDRILRNYRPTLLGFPDTLTADAQREYNRVAGQMHQALHAAERRIPLRRTTPPLALWNATISANNAETYLKSAAPISALPLYPQYGFPTTATVRTSVPRRDEMSLQLLRAERAIQQARRYLDEAGRSP